MSTTNNNCFVWRNSDERLLRLCPARAVTPNTAANASDHAVGIAHRRQLDQPRAFTECGTTSAATCNASRVLPTPPTPVNVTTRARPSGDRRSISCSRPMNELTCNGRFPRNASNDRTGGNSRRRSGCISWNTPHRVARSRNRCSPNATSSPSAGNEPRTSDLYRVRHQHLPAVSGRHQPCAPVQRLVHIPAVRPQLPSPRATPPAAATRPPHPSFPRYSMRLQPAPRPHPAPRRTPPPPNRPPSPSSAPPCTSIASRMIAS